LIRKLELRDVQVEFSRLEEDLVAARRALSADTVLNTKYRTSGGGGTTTTSAGDFNFDGGTIAGTSTGLILDFRTITDPGLVLDLGGIA